VLGGKEEEEEELKPEESQSIFSPAETGHFTSNFFHFYFLFV